jgi:hypothetical protein
MKNFLTTILTLGVACGALHLLLAAEHKEARLTQKVNDVRLLVRNTEARPAALDENVQEGTAVRTGTASRAELTFVDQTIARLGANTVFNVGTESRTYDLSGGAILMYAPKEAGSVKINTSVATAAVTGFTAMFEFHPRSWSKFIVLEGEGSFAVKGGSGGPCTLHGGQIIVIPPHPRQCPEIYNVDLGKLVTTSNLITKFPKLPSADLIAAVIKNQHTSPPQGGYVDPTNIDKVDQADSARPPKPPSPPTTPTIPPGIHGRP